MWKCNACVWYAMESAESARVWNRGACVFPRALCKWIGLHVVEMEALLHLSPNSWGHWKTCSVEIWSQLMSMTHCNNDACVWLTFPITVIELITKGSCYLYSLCLWQLCTGTRSMTIQTWGKLPTKCKCHCELWPPGSDGCPMIGRLRSHPTMLWVHVKAH